MKQIRKTKALYGEEAREAIIKGIDQVYNAVAPTMGAKGRNVMYKKWGMPIVTNDGVSIAREILPEDPYESIGAEAIKQASEQTNEEAGDGTSATIVLTKHIIEAGKYAIEQGANPMVLRREIEMGRDKLVKEIESRSAKIETLAELKQVAKISVEDEDLADLVSKIVMDAGKDGSITVEESPGTNVRTEVVKGYSWNKGYVSPYMVTNQKGEAVLENVPVILTDRYMNLNTDLIELISQLKDKGAASIMVIADNVEGELLSTLFENKKRGIVNVVVAKKPETKEELEDIAVVTGGVAVTQEKGFSKITLDHVGVARRVIVSRDKTVIVSDDTKDAVQARIDEIRNQIEAEDQEKYGLVELLKRRLSRLTGGVSRIKVGANTEAEQAYLKMKIDDAVGACRSALEEGTVAGGGTTLYDLVTVLDEEIPGELVLMTAIVKPYENILKNAGIVADGTKYNVLTGEEIEDMVEEGIVDPAKVVRCALKNAVSLAGIVLTTECVIVDIPPKPEIVIQD